MVECRICQEEDCDTSMEAPCACCGSLKYAHRKCIQRWCNEKGDTTCEICLQQFKPGYIDPQQLFHYGSIPMNFRGSWEIGRQDLHDSQIVAMMPSEHDFLDGYEDYLPMTTRSSTLCCRTVAIIFMALLVLRHTLPLMIGGNGEYSLALFSLLVLRTAGILFPIFVMARAMATFHRRRRRRRQESLEMYMSSLDTEEEEDSDTNSAQPIHSESRTRQVPVY
ncbi:hypothetical protein ABZP36_027295 [Zizania latifolia]